MKTKPPEPSPDLSSLVPLTAEDLQHRLQMLVSRLVPRITSDGAHDQGSEDPTPLVACRLVRELTSIIRMN